MGPFSSIRAPFGGSLLRYRNHSTPEPDGSVKKYMLRVDPKCRTAREAVAWTFDMEAGEYAPAIET